MEVYEVAQGSQELTTYYAKRIIGDNQAENAANALLQTGDGIATNTWLLHRTNRTNLYGIKYNYDDSTSKDKIELYGGYKESNVDIPTAWVQLNTGDTYLKGKVGIGYDPTTANNNSQLYVNGATTITGHLYLPGILNSTSYNTTTQIVFSMADGTKPVCITAYNGQAICINNSLTSATNNIILIPNGTSQFRTTTDASGYTKEAAGALHVAGGMGVAKAIYSGTKIYAGIATDTAERDVGVQTVAGSLYLYALGTTTSRKGLFARNAIGIVDGEAEGAMASSIFTINQNNRIDTLTNFSLGNKYVNFYNNNITRGTVPSEDAYTRFQFRSSETDNKPLGDIGQMTLATNGENEVHLWAYAPLSTTTNTWRGLRIFTGVASDDTVYGYAKLNTGLEVHPDSANYRQGIRIYSYGGWSELILCGSDLTAASGISTNSWMLGNTGGNIYLTKGSNTDATKENLSNVNGYWRLRGVYDAVTSGSNRSILHIYGPTYGNDAAAIQSSTAGIMTYGDGGPQITFDTSATPGGSQAGALLFTDHDTAGTGVSWHFLSNQSDWNVISKRFHARTSISIGTNLPVTTNALNVAGLIGVTNNSNTITIGSQNASFCHIYNSANIPFAFNKTVLSTSGGLGTTAYPWNDMYLNLTGGTSDLTDNTEILTSYASNNGFADSNAKYKVYRRDAITIHGYLNTKHTWVRLAGDTLGTTAQLSRVGRSMSWVNGRDGAIIRQTSYTGYNPIISMKTTNGSWELGPYTSDILYFSYATDANYNSSTNTSYQAVKITPNKGIYGAVWNDYAECRNIPDAQIGDNLIKPGSCVHEVGNGTMILTTKRLERGCKIISDTFGFCIGETDNCQTPIAVSGRALVYLLEGREVAQNYIGWPVCSGPNGTVSIMSEEEEEKYPSRIIGTISEIPDYEIWGSGNIEVNDRIWIYVK